MAAALSLVAVSIAVACGGSGDSSKPTATPAATHEMVIATFTPVPPNFTPEVVQTRAAQKTAYIQTATAQPPASPTAPGTNATPNTDAAACRPDAGNNELRPPDLLLNSSGGTQCGSVVSWNWYDAQNDRGANVQAPQGAPISESVLNTAAGEPMTMTVPASPYAVENARIDVYTVDGNVAMPRDAQGQSIPGLSLVFVPQTAPAWNTNIQGSNISFTPQLAPGQYIVAVRIDWAGPADVEAANQPLYTAYTFVIQVG
jgi:hypothetical protein